MLLKSGSSIHFRNSQMQEGFEKLTFSTVVQLGRELKKEKKLLELHFQVFRLEISQHNWTRCEEPHFAICFMTTYSYSND